MYSEAHGARSGEYPKYNDTSSQGTVILSIVVPPCFSIQIKVNL
jgi:hypothetical protein